MSLVERVRGVVGVVVVAAMALSATACFAPPPDDEDAANVSGSAAASVENTTTTGTTQQGFSYWGDGEGIGIPSPLDHPIPSFKMPKDISPPAPPDLDLFNEPYRLESPGCYIKTVAVFDPSRGKKIEILVTVCN